MRTDQYQRTTRMNRIDASDLVIYTAQPEGSIRGEPVIIDTFTTISAEEAGLGTKFVGWIVEKFAGGAIESAGAKTLEKVTSGGKPDGGTPASGGSTESGGFYFKEETKIRAQIDLGWFKATLEDKAEVGYGTPPADNKPPAGGTPPTDNKPPAGGTPPTDNKPLEKPDGGTPPADNKPLEKPDGGTPPPDNKPPDNPDGGVKVAPSDGSVPPLSSGAGEKFDEVMKAYLAMTFSDSASALEWYQGAVQDAGIEVTVTGNGFQVEDKLPDPAGVGEGLFNAGIRDRSAIRLAVYEANLALLSIEKFIVDAQSAMLNDVAASAPTDPVPSQLAFVPLWEQLVPASFKLHQGATSTTPAPAVSGTAPSSTSVGDTTPAEGTTPAQGAAPASSALADNLTPQMLMEMSHTTAHGLNVSVQLSTEIAAVQDPTLTAGVYALPHTSFFAGSTEWMLHA